MAIKPFNYDDPEDTPASFGGGRLKPFAYAPQPARSAIVTPPPAPKGKISRAANFVYNTIGENLLPTATPEELRNKQILKDSALGLPKAVFQVGKQVVTNPIQSSQSAAGSVARGLSESVTGIITNLFVDKSEKEAVSVEIQNILDKYLGSTPETNLSQGFKLAGEATPIIAATMAGGGAFGKIGSSVGGRVGARTGSVGAQTLNLAGQKLGGKVGMGVGGAAGFLGVGQLTVPTDATLQERAERAAKDLVSLGLFTLGSKAYQTSKSYIYNGLKTKIINDAQNSTPKIEPKIEPFDYSKTADEQIATSRETKYQEYRDSQGYEPIVPDSQLPTISMGSRSRAAGDLPVIQIGEVRGLGKRDGLTYEPIKESRSAANEAIRPTESASKGIVGVIETAQKAGLEVVPDAPNKALGVGDSAPLKSEGELASRVFERLKNEHPELDGDLNYAKVNLKKDQEVATEMLVADKQQTYRVAMNMESSTKVTSTSANIVMAEKALADGNVSLYERLVRNRSLAQTRRGQEIVAEKGSVNDNSTSRYVKELLSTRLEALGKDYLADVKTTFKKNSGGKQRGIDAIDAEVNKLEKKVRGKKLDVKTALDLLDKLACL